MQIKTGDAVVFGVVGLGLAAIVYSAFTANVVRDAIALPPAQKIVENAARPNASKQSTDVTSVLAKASSAASSASKLYTTSKSVVGDLKSILKFA